MKLGRMRKNVNEQDKGGVLYKRRIKLEVNPFTWEGKDDAP